MSILWDAKTKQFVCQLTISSVNLHIWALLGFCCFICVFPHTVPLLEATAYLSQLRLTLLKQGDLFILFCYCHVKQKTQQWVDSLFQSLARKPTIFCLWVKSAVVVFAICAALSLSWTSLVFGVTDGVTAGVLAWIVLPAGELWLVCSWHLSPKRSRKDFTPAEKGKQYKVLYKSTKPTRIYIS